MREPEDIRMYFYVDESGDPTILGRKGKDLLAEGSVSKVFMVGYVETANPKQIVDALNSLRTEIAADDYLYGIPSLASSLRSFHANEDCYEVKERVFKLLKQLDFKAYIIVARKSESLFRKKFGLDQKSCTNTSSPNSSKTACMNIKRSISTSPPWATPSENTPCEKHSTTRELNSRENGKFKAKLKFGYWCSNLHTHRCFRSSTTFCGPSIEHLRRRILATTGSCWIRYRWSMTSSILNATQTSTTHRNIHIAQ